MWRKTTYLKSSAHFKQDDDLHIKDYLKRSKNIDSNYN